MSYGAAGGAIAGIGANLINSFRSNRDPGRAEIEKALALLQQVQAPNFDFRQLTAPELQFIAQVDPVTYEARVPDDVKIAAESTARPAQLEALEGMSDIAREGMPLADRLAAQSASEAMAEESGRAQQAMMANLAARGRLGGGSELQARLMADRSQNALRSELGRGVAQDALQRRFDAVQAQGRLAGDVRGQDIGRELANAEMINRMNQFTSSLQTDAAKWAATQQMANRTREAEGRQRTSDTNRLLDYDVSAQNQERFNRAQQAMQQFRLDRARSQVGLYRDMATSRRAEQAAKERNQQQTGQGIGGLVGSLYSNYGSK